MHINVKVFDWGRQMSQAATGVKGKRASRVAYGDP
jgi:hypothetical protein